MSAEGNAKAMRRLSVLSRTVAPGVPAHPGQKPEQWPTSHPHDALHRSEATELLQHQPERVFFTGGAGFIGSNVLIYMVHKHPTVFFVCFDNLSEGSNRKNLEPIENAPNFLFVQGDITSESMVHSAMERHKIDTVMHFAAQTHVDRSFRWPVHFSDTNVVGTAVLLKVSHSLGVKRFLHISTDEVYGENVNGKVFDENSDLVPGNPYSASKAAAECLLRGYMSSFGSQLPIVVVRPNNIYGPRQFPEKLIPKFIYLLSRKQKLPLHGGGEARRSFLFVEDAARAFDLVLHRGVHGEAYNIGATTESTKSVLDVAKALLAHFGVASGQSQDYLDVVHDRAKNDASYDIHAHKIQALGWSPQVSFDDGLRRTVEWYKANPSHWPDVEHALLPHNGVSAPSKSRSAVAESTKY